MIGFIIRSLVRSHRRSAPGRRGATAQRRKARDQRVARAQLVRAQHRATIPGTEEYRRRQIVVAAEHQRLARVRADRRGIPHQSAYAKK
ncbi:MAG: hypothetical protein ACRDUW_18405 [Pseudonocardiaceae bacterium]